MSSIFWITGPLSSRPKSTLAVVCARSTTWPAVASAFDSAMVKQPACAAAMSSSGLVPLPVSKRDLKEYWPS
jgi:hypothetical protein